MKKLLLIVVCFFSGVAQARLWVHNKSKYYIKFVANSGEVLKISPGYADFDGDPFKYGFSTYNEYIIYVIKPDGSEEPVFKTRVTEGGNRKIVVKDNGSPNSIYIAEDILEIRIPSMWGGHRSSAEDVGTRWL